MKKLLLVLIPILIIGCTKPDTTQHPTQTEFDFSAIDTTEVVEVGLPTAEPESKDTDGDGIDDHFTYKSEKIEVQDGIFMTRNIEYQLTDEGYDGEVVLEFDGEGEYEHIEYFPKSFAEHIDDIEFSIEPDEIINVDPAAKWIIKTIKGKVSTITAKAKNEGTAKGAGAAFGTGLVEGIEQIGNLMDGKKYDFSKVGKAAVKSAKKEGGQAAADVILDNLGEFLLIGDLAMCAKKEPLYLEECVLRVIYKNPKQFSEKTCEEIFVSNQQEKPGQNACKAILKKSLKICVDEKNILGQTLSEVNMAKAMCIMYVMGASCKNPKEDQCRYDMAKEYKSENMCNLIKKDKKMKQMCLAEISQDPEHCQSLEDKKDCCDKIKNADDKKTCMGEEEDVEPEEEQEDEFSPGLKKLHKMNIVVVQFCTYTNQQAVRDGVAGEKKDERCVNFHNDVPLTWNGRLFEANHEEDKTDSFDQVTHYINNLEGSVAEDGSKVVRFTGFWEAKRLPFDHRYRSVALTELEFEGYPNGAFKHEMQMKGSDVKFHVTDPKNYQMQTTDDGREYTYDNMAELFFDDPDHPPIIKFRFENRYNWFPEEE